MRKTSWLILIIIVLLSVSLIYQNSIKNQSTSNEEQISEMIQGGKSAIERKDYRRTMSYISNNYSESNETSLESLRSMIIRAYKEPYKYSIVINDSDIKANGKFADATLDIEVYSTKGQENHMVYDDKITLRLENETARRWLVFPVNKWRVVGASGLPQFNE